MRQGKMEEAQTEFVEAVVAEPYARQSWVGLKQWADANKIQAGHPDIKAPQRPKESGKKEDPLTIVFDINSFGDKGKKDGTAAWFMYQLTEGVWKTTLFKKNYPDEKEYRHSLAEETAGLSMVATRTDEGLKKGELKSENLDSGIATLLKLYKAEMLEPFILLSRPDAGIAQDYAAYREKNRDKLRQYLRDFVVPKDRKP